MNTYWGKCINFSAPCKLRPYHPIVSSEFHVTFHRHGITTGSPKHFAFILNCFSAGFSSIPAPVVVLTKPISLKCNVISCDRSSPGKHYGSNQGNWFGRLPRRCELLPDGTQLRSLDLLLSNLLQRIWLIESVPLGIFAKHYRKMPKGYVHMDSVLGEKFGNNCGSFLSSFLFSYFIHFN